MRRFTLCCAVTVLTAACGTLSAVPGSPSTGATEAPLLAPASPVADGADVVTVLRSGEPTFTELRRLVERARRTVEVEVYEFGRADLALALIAAHDRGVAVTVIADPSESTTEATAQVLRASGVDVLDYPVRARMIDHVKLLVVDGVDAVVGGINWGAGSSANHDFDVEVRGPAVDNLDRVFIRDLVTCGRIELVPPARPDPAVLVGATIPGAEILPMVLGAIATARHTVDVAMYTLTDADVVGAMETALARGVSVRVLLDPSERPSDPSATSLRAHGVAVRLYRSTGEKLHAKAAIIDGSTVVLGSANWTVSGFEHNHELDVTIPADGAVATSFEEQYQSDWAASA